VSKKKEENEGFNDPGELEAGRGKPRIPASYMDCRELQKSVMKMAKRIDERMSNGMAADENAPTASALAQLARAYDLLEHRKVQIRKNKKASPGTAGTNPLSPVPSDS
jgi:hypothetical protein